MDKVMAMALKRPFLIAMMSRDEVLLRGLIWVVVGLASTMVVLVTMTIKLAENELLENKSFLKQ